MNFSKRLSSTASLISATSYMMASSVLRLFDGDALPSLAISPRDLMLPGSPYLPRNKHGRCKRGGRSKQRRGLNYWRT